MISLACLGAMHPACTIPDECDCSCHQVCRQCGRTTGRLYTEAGLCSTCYLAEPPVPHGCEGCGAPRAYRDPREGEQYLCSNCHQAAGHRYQVGGRWQNDRS